MKKAKFILIIVGISAVVGGSMAFKVKSNMTIWVKVGTTCPPLMIQSTVTNEADYMISYTRATTVNPQGDCTKCNQTIYLTEE